MSENVEKTRIRMVLDGLPRVKLAHLPTPLEPLERLSRHLGGPDIWIKRDDCTGLATGGNKTRKLEFLLGEALQSGADTVVTAGAVQSNHVRQTAAACARLGLDCEAVLEDEVPCRQTSYRRSGNVLLDGLLNCDFEVVPCGSDTASWMDTRAKRLRDQGKNPYVVPVGGSNVLGAMGYVDCALEMVSQAAGLSLEFDHLVLASGSGGTQAGLLAGLAAEKPSMRVTGISVSADRSTQVNKVQRLTEPLASRLGLATLSSSMIEVDDGFVGEGYGLPTEDMRAALALCARLEGLLLDPVYSGKAMAGLVEKVRNGIFKSGEQVLFLHTGGSTGLFAYDWFFEPVEANT